MSNKHILLAAKPIYPTCTHSMHIELMDTIGRKERDAKLKELEKCGVFALSEFWLVETTEPDGGWHVYGAIRGPHLRMLLGGFYGLDDIRLSQVKVTHA